MTQTLSVPSVKVNNDTLGIVPNTFKFKSGDGEVNVRAASTGGGNAVSVHSQNAETMFSTVSFSLYLTSDNMQKIRDWKALVNGLTVQAMQTIGNSDFSMAIKGASLITDPDFNASSDGVIELEFAGDKLE